MRGVKKIITLFSIITAPLYAISPYISIRSQGANLARTDVGTTNFVNLHRIKTYGTLSALYEYQRSFNPHALAHNLLGCDVVDCNNSQRVALTIAGSRIARNGATDWLADYFGLPTDFKSVVSFEPVIQNHIFDFNLYVGLDDWAPGLYFNIQAPLVHTKWDMQMRECIESQGVNGYDPGYFSAQAESNLLHNFTEFVSAERFPTFTSLTIGDTTWPATIFQALSFGKISTQPLVRNGLAELRSVVGWNHACDDYHVGVNFRFIAPTGTKPRGEFLFEPLVGNGDHWECGLGLTGHYDFWYNEDESVSAAFLIDTYFTHLFKARQRRIFDLTNKPNSRYMLAQKLGTARASPRLATPTFAAVEFQAEVSPVANLTTLRVDVDAAVQGELVAMFTINHCRCSWDFGYNFWGRSCEHISRVATFPTPLDSSTTWALKGDASVIGFLAGGQPVNLAATESNATIHAGTNFPADGTTNSATILAARQNPNIDSPAPAVTTASAPVYIQGDILRQVNSSTGPVFITFDDLNLEGTYGISHKLFAHFNYTWATCGHWTPYLGCGGEVEFGNNRKNCCTTISCCVPGCPPCSPCTVSQWGFWIKLGIAYQ